MPRFCPRHIVCKLQNLITIEVIVGIPGRPFASKLDILTLRMGVVVIEPLLYFLKCGIKNRPLLYE